MRRRWWVADTEVTTTGELSGENAVKKETSRATDVIFNLSFKEKELNPTDEHTQAEICCLARQWNQDSIPRQLGPRNTLSSLAQHLQTTLTLKTLKGTNCALECRSCSNPLPIDFSLRILSLSFWSDEWGQRIVHRIVGIIWNLFINNK